MSLLDDVNPSKSLAAISSRRALSPRPRRSLPFAWKTLTCWLENSIRGARSRQRRGHSLLGALRNILRLPTLPPEPACAPEQSLEDAILCLTIGRLAPVKGYQFQPRSPLKVYGRSRIALGPSCISRGLEAEAVEIQCYIREQLQQLGSRRSTSHFWGAGWDVADWLDASDMFVLPSLYEGMPLAIMEAMAKGSLPVIASAVSGIPEELGSTWLPSASAIAQPTSIATVQTS